MVRIVLTLLCVFLAVPFAFAGAIVSTLDDQDSVEVTVYNSNIGLVKDTRHLKLAKGGGELRFMDVASGIMPYTVHIQSLDDASALSVLEQNYEYDLMDSNKLLDKYVGKDIKLLNINPYQDKKETIEATLLSNNNGPIYKINNEIYLGHPGYQVLPEIPENLIAKPTLTWLYDSASDASQKVQVSYLTSGVNWRADYVVVVNSDDTSADLGGWVTLDNQSGATYKNAQLKLVAGQVNRVQNAYAAPESMLAGRAADSVSQFQEQSFFEYHIYDLQRKTTIKNNQTKQVSLLDAAGIKVEKEFIVRGEQQYYYGNYSNQSMKPPVNVFLKFRNSKDNHLGMPLPAGTMRLYKEDSKKSLQFIGEDAIKHIPKDEDVELRVGEAFDVVAERVQTNFQQYNRAYDTEWEITLRNHKEGNIKVAVIEPLYGDWQVLKSSLPYKKVDAATIRFDVDVAKDQEVKVTYAVRVRTP